MSVAAAGARMRMPQFAAIAGFGVAGLVGGGGSAISVPVGLPAMGGAAALAGFGKSQAWQSAGLLGMGSFMLGAWLAAMP